jgi:hypothetical protein
LPPGRDNCRFGANIVSIAARFLLERMMSHNRNTLFAFVLTAVSLAATASEITFLGKPPESIAVGEPYAYVPVVTNAIMPDVEFSYINRPSWSGIYRSSGAILGTPTEPGVYSNIQIQAWDGVNFGVSAPFTIVVSSTTGSADLRWVKPMLNTDGSPLTNLAGYLIHYGSSTANLDTKLFVDSPDSTALQIDNLSPGKWYFKIAAVTDTNVQGPFSTVVGDTIR